MNDQRPLTLSYIAGLFDGEGCVSVTLAKGSSGMRKPRITLSISQSDRGVIEWLHQTLGYGHISQPRPGHWQLQVNKTSHILDFIDAIEPYSKIKKEKLRDAYILTRLTGNQRNHAAVLWINKYKTNRRTPQSLASLKEFVAQQSGG